MIIRKLSIQFSVVIIALVIVISLNQCRDAATILYPLSESWELVIPHQEIPPGLTSISAKECGECHKDYYEEWKTSTHALAWADLQFQAEIKKESSPFFCINCHIPLQDQQDSIVLGKIGNDIYKPLKVINPHFDQSLQIEAITCAVCHVRDGAIIAMSENNSAPHKTKKDRKFLSESLCISCHNASAHISEQLVCSFETGDEWKAGKYYGVKNCIGCHMGEVRRPLMKGFDSRASHYHNFPGSGIPKFKGLTTGILNGLSISVSHSDTIFYKYDSISITVRLKNDHAGHRVPTGDPERFILLNAVVLNISNDTLAYMDHRVGEHWKWYPEVEKLSDNNFEIEEERSYTYSFVFNNKGAYRSITTLTKHRMDDKTARYNGLDDTYPLFIQVYRDTTDIIVK